MFPLIQTNGPTVHFDTGLRIIILYHLNKNGCVWVCCMSLEDQVVFLLLPWGFPHPYLNVPPLCMVDLPHCSLLCSSNWSVSSMNLKCAFIRKQPSLEMLVFHHHPRMAPFLLLRGGESADHPAALETADPVFSALEAILCSTVQSQTV